MLEVRDLSVAYGQHRALDGAHLRVDRGEIVVILGANGAGKSTLLKAVSGICEGAVAGSILLDGHELVGQSPDRIVEEGVALVPEGRGIFGDLTVEENLTLGAFADRARGDESANLSRVYSLFPKLTERRRQTARTMSGGEQQMVAIGRAMMSNPQILTLDEPSLGLSPLLCKELFQNLKAVRDLGIGILLVEQNARQSLAIADRGYLLENAHIVHEDSADALAHDPAVQAAYLGAGGAASPHTYDDEVDEVGAEATVSSDAPFAIRAPSRATQSADAVLGTSVSDLVAKASSQATETTDLRRTDTSVAAPNGVDQTDRLRAAIKEIENAAARARTARGARRGGPMSTGTTAAVPKGASHPIPAPEPTAPVTIEVYRAPRVEVYRRRPGSTAFERD
ncbi:MAG: ABC transporter ATP-binding protein [Pseudomonadota bacterium]